jgi:hypothetical protein
MSPYEITLFVHSYLRWIALGLFVVVLVRSIRGWLGAREWTKLDERLHIGLVSAIDIQLLLGLLLYIVLSPIAQAFFANPGASMKDAVVRYVGVEHITGMLIVVVIVHVGRVRSKRAGTAKLRHRRVWSTSLAALLLVLASIPWPFLKYGRPILRGFTGSEEVASAVCPPVYADRCATCHGASGRGDGVAATAFNPRPRDFATELGGRSDEQIGLVIMEGGAAHGLGAGMPAHPDLSDEEVAVLVACVRSFRDGR